MVNVLICYADWSDVENSEDHVVRSHIPIIPKILFWEIAIEGIIELRDCENDVLVKKEKN